MITEELSFRILSLFSSLSRSAFDFIRETIALSLLKWGIRYAAKRLSIRLVFDGYLFILSRECQFLTTLIAPYIFILLLMANSLVQMHCIIKSHWTFLIFETKSDILRNIERTVFPNLSMIKACNRLYFAISFRSLSLKKSAKLKKKYFWTSYVKISKN